MQRHPPQRHLLLLLLAAAANLQLSSQQCQYRNGYIYECSHNELTRMGQLDGPTTGRRAVTTVDISYNKFAEFDSAFLAGQFPGVQQLLAGSNLIEGLADPGTVTWPELRLLKLSGNRIETVGSSDFAFATGLATLHLDNNRIHSLRRGCFSRCHNLTLLDLTSNKLDYLSSDYFWGLWALEHLYLSHNQLTGLPPDTFGHLHRLTALDLGHNRIKSLAHSALRGLPALARLGLSANQLSEFPCDGLHSAPGLRWLDASGNPLHALYRGAVARLPALETLLLNASTELRLVDAGALSELPALVRLDLSGSPDLRYVSAAAFDACPELFELRLAGCRLAVAPLADWRQRLPRLSVADVADNSELRDPTTAVAVGGVLVLDLFPAEIVLSEGHRLKLPCRSYPEGRARWQLPPAAVGGHLRHHVTVTPEQDLLLHDAFDRLSGVYACTVTSSGVNGGNRTAVANRREVSIVVKRMESQLILLKVTENSIVLTWQKLANPDDYVLMYRARGATADHYYRVRLQSYMKRYSISGLQPGSPYQLCLALKTYSDYQHLHCIVASTKSGRESDGRNSMFINGRIIIFLVIGIAVSVGVLVACLVACSLSRDKEGDSWSQASLAGSRWSDSQPMTFENRAADEYHNFDSDAEDRDDGEEEERLADRDAADVTNDLAAAAAAVALQQPEQLQHHQLEILEQEQQL